MSVSSLGSKENFYAEKALGWIVDILDRHQIPFQVIGGFAARAYGAKRNLADIDIVISSPSLSHILPEIKDYITFGPAPYKDNEWDIHSLITLVYNNQEIDLATANAMKIFDIHTKQWEPFPFDLSNNSYTKIANRDVPLISKEVLIQYKTALGRDVDNIDIEEIQNARSRR